VSVGARDVNVGGHRCRRGCRERGVARALRSAFPSRPGTMMTCMTSLEGEKKNKTRARGPRVAKQMSRVSSHDCRERDAYFSNTPQPKPSWSEADGAAPRPRSRPARRGPRATLAWKAPGARLKYQVDQRQARSPQAAHKPRVHWFIGLSERTRDDPPVGASPSLNHPTNQQR